MSELGTIDVSAEAHRRQQQQLMMASSNGPSTSGPERLRAPVSRLSRLAEVPNQPFTDIEIQAAVESAGKNLWGFQPRSISEALADPTVDPRDPLAYVTSGTGKALDGSTPIAKVRDQGPF